MIVDDKKAEDVVLNVAAGEGGLMIVSSETKAIPVRMASITVVSGTATVSGDSTSVAPDAESVASLVLEVGTYVLPLVNASVVATAGASIVYLA